MTGTSVARYESHSTTTSRVKAHVVDTRTFELALSQAGCTQDSSGPLTGMAVGSVQVKTYSPTVEVMKDADGNSLGFGNVKAIATVKLPRGNYFIHVVELSMDDQGYITGCAGTNQPFSSQNGRRWTQVTSTQPFFSGGHWAQVFITRADDGAKSLVTSQPISIFIPYVPQS